ncbi:hypothetical protein ACFPOE_07480 [Caenimonas terrae]|uniref:DUF2783 domain-containing protein n=1 Tax=Caenimonas terrae TaxID=696074 RepID=A0ABW0N9Z6_9BURK
MTDADLDRSYSALAAALADAGEGAAPLLLSMLCLSLMARAGSADEVLPLIARARAQLAGDADGSR